MRVQGGFRALTCPNCGCEFGITAYLVLRTEFPCPYCDAVLSVSNRKEIAHKKKVISIPFLISAISLIILLFVTMGVILSPYLSPQVVIALIIAYSFILLMLFILGRAMSAAEKGMKLEVVRLRPENHDTISNVVDKEEAPHRNKTLNVLIPLLIAIYIILLALVFTPVTRQPVWILVFPLLIVQMMIGGIGFLKLLEAGGAMRPLEVVLPRQSCRNCGFPVEIENARFCPRCGAELRLENNPDSTLTEHVGTTELRERFPNDGRIRKCILCGQDVKSHHNTTECPSCGGIFHTPHLLEYLHVHGGCPQCGKRLDETIQAGLPTGDIARPSRKKRGKPEA